MWLIVGLGNPGSQYAGNRHNIGFRVVEAIAARHRFGPFRAKFQAEIAEGDLDGEKCLIAKPHTFMNESGQAVGQILRFYKIPPTHLVVLHDELDLPPGKLRAKIGGGHGGHNGLRSIDAHIGPQYRRIRLGIGHPGDKARVTGWVLGNFAAEEDVWLTPLLAACAEVAPRLCAADEQAFVQAVGQRLAPPKPPRPPKQMANPASQGAADA